MPGQRHGHRSPKFRHAASSHKKPKGKRNAFKQRQCAAKAHAQPTAGASSARGRAAGAKARHRASTRCPATSRSRFVKRSPRSLLGGVGTQLPTINDQPSVSADGQSASQDLLISPSTPPGDQQTPPASDPPTAPPTTTTTTTTPPPQPPPPPPPPGPVLLNAQGESFAGQPSDVLLTYSEAATPVGSSPHCVGLDASGNSMTFGGIDQAAAAQTIRLELVPGGTMPSQVQCSAGNATDADGNPSPATEAITIAASTASPGGVETDPIDPKFLTEVPFGDRSYWIQPWRSYLDTWPASRLTDSLGINFNVTSAEAPGTAQLLQDSGFKLARIEIPWGALSYSDPTQFVNKSQIDKLLGALHGHGLRPLILLNANSGNSAPAKKITLHTTVAAAAGARSVVLDSASAAQVAPGKTGFDSLVFGGYPDVLITAVSASGVATLARPLPAALAAGDHQGATLMYAPFGPPQLSNGDPDPAFQSTMQGWLSYVSVVSREAQSIFGTGGYDLEVWNELSFGSQFLDANNYYSSPRETGTGSVTGEIFNQTVAYIRDPANGISPDVGVTDGFGSQTPFASGALLPAGTTAISKHLYASGMYFPASDVTNGIKPIDALGQADAKTGGTLSHPTYSPFFVPTYRSLLPEYYLSATQTESAIRDIAPITTSIYRVPHGRSVGPPGSAPTQTWMTEYNLNAMVAPVTTDQTILWYQQLTPADIAHFQAKALLRSLVSTIGKGMTREYLYTAAHNEGFNVIDDGFISALDAQPASYPGDQLGGPTTDAFRNMMPRFGGPGPSGAAQQLQLLSIAQDGNNAQFSGDGSAAHPNLYDRDVLGVFPFQSSPTRFVIPVYVMTRDLATLYKPNAPTTDTTRFDLPDETFRITLGNLPSSSAAPAVSAYDPLHNDNTPARLVSRQADRAVFEFAATDYPRLLVIDYSGA
jgi:hypothetical protein